MTASPVAQQLQRELRAEEFRIAALSPRLPNRSEQVGGQRGRLGEHNTGPSTEPPSRAEPRPPGRDKAPRPPSPAEISRPLRPCGGAEPREQWRSGGGRGLTGKPFTAPRRADWRRGGRCGDGTTLPPPHPPAVRSWRRAPPRRPPELRRRGPAGSCPGRPLICRATFLTHLPSSLQRVFKGIVHSSTSTTASPGGARSRRGHRGIVRHTRSATASCPARCLPRKKENGGGREPFTFLRCIVLGEGGGRAGEPRETWGGEGRDFIGGARPYSSEPPAGPPGGALQQRRAGRRARDVSRATRGLAGARR